jgi:TolB-like protein
MRLAIVLLLVVALLADVLGAVGLYLLSARVSAVEAAVKERPAEPPNQPGSQDLASARKDIDGLTRELGGTRGELEQVKKALAAKPADAGASPVSPRSVAVLPFQNLYPKGGEATKLADSIPEDITTRLSKNADLHVVASSVIASHKKGDFPWSDPREAGRRLNVAAVITGKITLERGYVTILVELVRVTDGKALWSQQFSQYDEFENVNAINKFLNDLVKQITEQVEMKLTAAKDEPGPK